LRTRVGSLAFFVRVVRSWNVASAIEAGSPSSVVDAALALSPKSMANEDPVL